MTDSAIGDCGVNMGLLKAGSRRVTSPHVRTPQGLNECECRSTQNPIPRTSRPAGRTRGNGGDTHRVVHHGHVEAAQIAVRADASVMTKVQANDGVR